MQRHTKLSFHTSLLVTLICFFTSCTIEKRHFSNGYSVQWKKHYRQTETTKASVEDLRQEETAGETNSSGISIPNESKVTAETSQSDPILPEEFVSVKQSNEDQCEYSKSGKTEIKHSEKKTNGFKQEQQKKERSNVKKGIFMLIYALLFSLLGLAFGGLGAFGAVFAVIFYSVAGIAALFGIIFIIIGIAKRN